MSQGKYSTKPPFSLLTCLDLIKNDPGSIQYQTSFSISWPALTSLRMTQGQYSTKPPFPSPDPPWPSSSRMTQGQYSTKPLFGLLIYLDLAHYEWPRVNRVPNHTFYLVTHRHLAHQEWPRVNTVPNHAFFLVTKPCFLSPAPPWPSTSRMTPGQHSTKPHFDLLTHRDRPISWRMTPGSILYQTSFWSHDNHDLAHQKWPKANTVTKPHFDLVTHCDVSHLVVHGSWIRLLKWKACFHYLMLFSLHNYVEALLKLKWKDALQIFIYWFSFVWA